ncbi:MAG: flagellar protein FlgN [Clostridiales bacterium]|nr:flagellar protein FlgN [Eubacteriales bacterium]MDH7566173.1 flagellar protein FlgN [Clostridiales bacterium]
MNKLDANVIGELIGVLGQEARVYESLLKMSKDKTRIIVEGKVGELENMVKLEQSLVLQVGRLEAMREEIVEKCSKQTGDDISNLTITELQKYVDEEDAQKLKNAQEHMAGILDGLKSANELNARLIKNSLDFINFSINMFAGISTGNNNYGSTGQASGTEKRSFFDIKL